MNAAVRALAQQPLSSRQIARAFSILLIAERAVFFPGDGDHVSTLGTDGMGAEVRRYAACSLTLPDDVHTGYGADGLLPIACAEPGRWLSMRMGASPVLGGVVALGMAEELDRSGWAVLDAFVDLAIARIVADRDVRIARHAAMTDPMTGLLRREGLDAFVSGLTRYLVMFIDLNGLKRINDAEGHEAGDAYLKRASDAFRSALRPGDPLARIGGDEFVAILTGSAPEAAIRMRFEKVCANTGVSGSIGFAKVPDEASDLAAAIKLADTRMYVAKEAYYAANGLERRV